jgi:DNA adenine methylase
MSTLRRSKLKPIIKWAGGKELELQQIIPNLPHTFDRYYEPFVGGGAVYFTIDRPIMFINDRSTELIGVYELIKKQDISFFNSLITINYLWRFIEKITENHNREFIDLYTEYSSGDLPPKN